MFQENDCGINNCAGLNAGTDKASKNPKIRALIDEIINDDLTEDNTNPPEKSPVDVFGEKALHLPPPTIIGWVFREKLLPKASPPEVVAETFQEKVSSCVISREIIIRNRITTKN